MIKYKNLIKPFIPFSLIIVFFLVSKHLLIAANPLEEALKEKEFKIKDDVIITKPCNVNKQICEIEMLNKNRYKDLDLFLLKMKLKQPLHSIDKGILKVKKTQKKIEKEISKDIKKLFLLPKKIKVKSEIKKDKIYTKFIYRLED